ncbi:MAG: DUF5103 domain-containing protein [Bacteroidia bacterium]|nr:DUF5103 domain-containing protein [Bacteroidia bacterium]
MKHVPGPFFPLVVVSALMMITFTGCPPKEVAQKPRPKPVEAPLIGQDAILDGNIKTVQIYRDGTPGAMPVTFIGGYDPITLEFDELRDAEERESDFFVDLIACDQYWRPVQVLPIEFYEGFTQDRIQIFQRSEFTKVDYVHYEYSFPQENEAFKLSGNYLIKVFRDGDASAVVLTRRFVVVESLVGIGLTGELNQAPRRRRMEQINFLVNPGKLQVFNPMNDLHVSVMPNFRFDQQMSLRPVNILNDQLLFEVDLLRSFPNGHEFRPLDIRSTRFLSASIQDVEERDDVFDVYLFSDNAWLSNTFGRQPDLNGSYFIEVQEWQRPSVQSDYVYVYFSAPRSAPIPDKEVYVIGKFTDWALNVSNRMRWNEEVKEYQVEMLLKQGYYDYQYVTAANAQDVPESSTFQGRLGDAENSYFVLVYFRGPIDRNDRVVGYWSVNGQ